MLSSISFFNQSIILEHREERTKFFKELINNKSTLHIGCADWPIYNPDDNLHIMLCETFKNKVDGFDVDITTLNKMKEYPSLVDENLFSELPDKVYDFLLIPEVIEHINNVEKFLLDITKCVSSSTQILITAPNAFCKDHIERNNDIITSPYIEIVHPDHNCWYSPYTLPNTIRKVYNRNNININFVEIGTLENNTMVYCLFTVDK